MIQKKEKRKKKERNEWTSERKDKEGFETSGKEERRNERMIYFARYLVRSSIWTVDRLNLFLFVSILTLCV